MNSARIVVPPGFQPGRRLVAAPRLERARGRFVDRLRTRLGRGASVADGSGAGVLGSPRRELPIPFC